MSNAKPLKIAITCYPSVGGSGILASALGEELAARGHEVHFISYERPFRLPQNTARIHFHPVIINDYDLFKYPDYTLPLSVKMAEVSRAVRLDILHVHYAVPHATAAILAQAMLPAAQQPRVVTTLHGTDTTLLGRDSGYGPAIRHALLRSDAVTAVSQYLKDETHRLLEIDRAIDVIPNFFSPRPTTKSRQQMRDSLGIADEVLVFHSSNLRPVKRIDLLLEAAARIRPREAFKLLILAGGEFGPFAPELHRLNLDDRVIVRQNVFDIEEYLQASDVGLFASEMESFCLGILEGMYFGCPSVSTGVGGIPEVIAHNATGILTPAGDPQSLASALQALILDPKRRIAMGHAAQSQARARFSAQVVVPQYEALYRRVCAQ